jgi:hypothetical protein
LAPELATSSKTSPLSPSLIFPSIIANPLATTIISHMLSPSPRFRFLSANTAFKTPTSKRRRQPVHVDVHFKPLLNIPFGFCININLIDVDPEHGSTEVWLGSHLDTSWQYEAEEGSSVILIEMLEEREKFNPPMQPTLPKGSLIIRDLRLACEDAESE